MNIDRIVVGYLEENCYFLTKNNVGIIIDPGDEFEKIEHIIGDTTIKAILITHHHFDHIGALKKMIDKYKCPVFDFYNTDEKKYSVDGFEFEVIRTPGHSSDSISFLFGNDLFCGDFIFKQNIGRTDLQTGSVDDMKKSISMIKKYRNLNIFPGHGATTTLEDEKMYNCYF